MKRLIGSIHIVIALFVLHGCTYDKEEILRPPAPVAVCDTANMRYSVEVMSIFNTNLCMTCHGTTASSTGNGIRLDQYGAIRGLIDLANIDNGRLMRSITHTGPFPMPKNAAKMSNCNIAKIRAWIQRGAPNN